MNHHLESLARFQWPVPTRLTLKFTPQATTGEVWLCSWGRRQAPESRTSGSPTRLGSEVLGNKCQALSSIAPPGPMGGARSGCLERWEHGQFAFACDSQ